MALDITTTVDQVASDLVGDLVDDAHDSADQEAADAALALIGPRAPRRTGALAAGLRSVVAPSGGFAVVDAQPYAGFVDARTGFATRTLIDAGSTIADIYTKHLQANFDQV